MGERLVVALLSHFQFVALVGSHPRLSIRYAKPHARALSFLEERVGLLGASMHPTPPRYALRGRPSTVQICSCKFVEPAWVLTPSLRQKHKGPHAGAFAFLAERVGFEPTVGLHLRQFSRLLP